MPDTASLVLIKEFTYRDEPEEFSNKYHFEGTIPATPADWQTLIDGWAVEEMRLFSSAVHLVRGYGYEPGSNHANFVADYTAAPLTPKPGTFIPTVGDLKAPGDAAATVRWNTGEYNSRGKLIYCRKYFHEVWHHPADNDEVSAAQLAAYGQFGAVVISGFFPGSAKYCGPQGANLTSPIADKYITTRTLKRRGKRPLVSAP
jgi:hypothetical protein